MTGPRDQSGERALGTLIALWIITVLTSFAAWMTHVVICVHSEQWLLLIAGTIAFPVGIVHGIGHWFGIW